MDEVFDQDAIDQEPGAQDTGSQVAIVGMAGRFPGAQDIHTFWQNLAAGVESIRFFDLDQVETDGLIDPAQIHDPHFVKAGGVLEGADQFDAAFFHYYPREAAIIDPQQRVFLETAWEALENAGVNPDSFPGWIGVYAGSSFNTYLMLNLLGNRELLETVHGYQLTISNDKDFLPTRVAYKLNLRGPAVNVQSACSTSLVAAHLACQSLINYQCDLALAGGVAIRLPQQQGYLYQEGGITSPDGHCRAFDAQAQGTVPGNGVGVVVLKRLEDALADGDHIYAVIRGTAINNDGSLKVGYTAPSVDGQAAVIATAQAVANVEPGSVSYIETHGTGTALGDPIELAALTQVFNPDGSAPRHGVAIGSLKTNIGHLDAAAGVASLIKTALALHHRQIPPSLHFEKPNPQIDFANSPFFVNTELRDWEADSSQTGYEGPRRAGVSSFGIGGTNAHAVLEEPPALEPGSVSRPWQMLIVSARDEEALQASADRLAQHLRLHPTVDLADVAYTLQVGRKAFNHRLAVVARDHEDAIRQLSPFSSPEKSEDPAAEALKAGASGLGFDPQRRFSSEAFGASAGARPRVVFLFSGQGAQYVDMGKELYESEPVFREEIDRCAEILQPVLGLDLRDLIYPASLALEDAQKLAEAQLRDTAIAQPALFAIEYALAQLWMSWGVVPEAMLGHSIGEYVAACLAGVFTLEDALVLVAERGRLMSQLEPGAMLSIALSETEAHLMLQDTGLALAAINAPQLCVASGPLDAVERLVQRLRSENIEFRRLHTSHAFHSAMMEPVLQAFEAKVAQALANSHHAASDDPDLSGSLNQIPWVSNLTGNWVDPQQALRAPYWVNHLRHTVRFADGIDLLLKDSGRVFVEVGPGRSLAGLVKVNPAAADRLVAGSIRHPQDRMPDGAYLLGNLARLWLAGVNIDWPGFYAFESRRKTPLPSYPFQRQRFWIKADYSGPAGHALHAGSATANALADGRLAPQEGGTGQSARSRLPGGRLQRLPQVSDWFYTPSWQRAGRLTSGLGAGIQIAAAGALPAGQATGDEWLLYSNNVRAGEKLAAFLQARGERLTQVTAQSGARLGRLGKSLAKGRHYILDPQDAAQAVELFKLWAEDTAAEDTAAEDKAAQQSSENGPTRTVQARTRIRPDRVLYLGADSDDPAEGEAAFYGLLHLVQALGQREPEPIDADADPAGAGNSTAPVQADVRLAVITTGAIDVTGLEAIRPEEALLSGLCKVISQEYAHIACVQVDLDAAAWEQAPTLQALTAELAQMPEPATTPLWAYRGAYRWQLAFTPLPAASAKPGGAPGGFGKLRQSGVYLITGGLGRIGLALAEHLAANLGARLVLVDRPEPVADATSSDAGKSSDQPSARRRSIQRLRELGSECLILAADVSVAVELRQVVQETLRRFGALHGVIHAAGLVGDAAIRSLVETDAAVCQAQFSAKVAGVRALEKALDGLDLDFCLLQSSLAAVLGGMGMGAYAAANAYMDAFAARHNQKYDGVMSAQGGRWISANWDGWYFASPADSAAGQEKQTLQGAQPAAAGDPTTVKDFARRLDLSMTPDEGMQAFQLLFEHLLSNPAQVVISTADMDSRMAIALRAAGSASFLEPLDVPHSGASLLQPGDTALSSTTTAGAARPATDRHPRPKLPTPFVAARSELEQGIADLWERVLGIGPIGVYDDFFELGGHSLLATQLITRMRDTYQVEIPLRKVFESPNIAGIAQLIVELRSAEQDVTESSSQGPGMPDGVEKAELAGGEIPVEAPAAAQGAPAPEVSTRLPAARADSPEPFPLVGRMPGDRQQPLVLSSGQQRMWFLDRLEPGSALYHNFAALRLTGQLDVNALERSMQLVVQRHEILRTSFEERDGVPVQIIHPEVAVSLQVRELNSKPMGETAEAALQMRIEELAMEEMRQPFDLETPPLFRALLYAIPAVDGSNGSKHTQAAGHVLFLTMHHIISDGWSVLVLVREIGSLYRMLLEGWSAQAALAALPALPVQYADYAAWQRRWLQGENLEKQLEFWRAQLSGAESGLELPYDRPRPAIQTSNGGTHWFELDPALAGKLQRLGQENGATLFMVLLAALQALLYRHSGQEDISIGTPVANRNRAETEGLIGFLLNTVVLRTDVSGNPSFLDLLQRVRETALNSFAHAELPFETLVEHLQPERDMSRAPFFQVIFDLQVAALQGLDLPGLSISPLKVDTGTAKFDLALSMEMGQAHPGAPGQRSQTLAGYFNFNRDLFDPSTISNLVARFQRLLAAIVDQPHKPIAALEMLGQDELAQTLASGRAAAWSPSAALRQKDLALPGASPARFQSVASLFQAQVRQHPDAPALGMLPDASGAAGDPASAPIMSEPLTYAQLAELVERVAGHLRSHGVGKNMPVALLAERSIPAIVGLLAIFRAGGVYLPLDPDAPAERLAFMLQDSALLAAQAPAAVETARQPVILTSHSLSQQGDELCQVAGYRKLVLEQLIESPAAEKGLFAEIAPQDPAYVIYTSGSTGRPKGVLVSQQAISGHCLVVADHFGLQSSDRVLQFSAYSFDQSLEQILTAFLRGATLLLRGPAVWEPSVFTRIVTEQRLSVVNIQPAYWRQWMQSAESPAADAGPEGQTALRLVIIGGDVVLPEDIRQWGRTRFNAVRLLNAYGPTETTVTAATYEMQSHPAPAFGRVPIGRPLQNRVFYILGRHGEVVPRGVPGELVIGGAYLAEGYLNQPALSAEKFTPDPLDASLRVYHTGDLARCLPDGNFEFIGRMDSQVKLRGFRIELGEIEAILRAHPAVGEVVVVLRGAPATGPAPAGEGVLQQLVAYFVPRSADDVIASTLAASLREFLKQHLPGYMIPAAFVALPALPLLASGKVDRKALPAPGRDDLHSGVEYQAPQTPIEKELALIWQELLGVSRVGTQDNFFEAGGHSLLVTQMAARLRRQYGLELPLRRLFETPTIAALGAFIEEQLVTNTDEDELAALLTELEGLSEDEVRAMLDAEAEHPAQPTVGSENEGPAAGID